MWEGATTHAHGIRVPKAIGDFLMLRGAAGRATAPASRVSEAEIVQGVKDASAREGLFMCPEGGACVAALRKLKANGHLSPDDVVVVFNTGTGFKYVENMSHQNVSRRTVLKGGGAALAGLTVLRVAGPAHAFPGQSAEQERMAWDDDQSDSAQTLRPAWRSR